MSAAPPVSPDRPAGGRPGGPAARPRAALAVVGHDASRSGAPQVLATFLRWAEREHPGRIGRVLLVRGGPLLPQLAQVAPVSVLPPAVAAAGDLGGAAGRALRGRVLRRARDAEVVLVNTLAALPAAVDAVGPSLPRLVCWVHELDGVAERVLPAAWRARVLDRVVRGVAAGPAVAGMLVDRWGVDAALVRIVAPFVDEPDPSSPSGPVADAGPPLLLGIGALGPRKGTDRFIDLVSCWPSGPEAPRGVWVGGDPGSVAWGEAMTDLRLGGLGDRVRLVPTVADVSPHLGAATMFVSTAREDPFPLVAIEAGVRGVPVVATDSGGVADLLAGAGHAGAVVAPGDVLALRDVIDDLLADPGRRHALGRDLQRWVRNHHVTDVAAPALWSALVEDR